MATRRMVTFAAIGAGTQLISSYLTLPSAAGVNDRGASSDHDPRAASKVRYIRPIGSGRSDGTDWDNAAPLPAINSMIVLVGPGGVVRLLSEQGPYVITQPIILSRGGSAGNPVRILGCDNTGAPAAAFITGKRTSPYPATREGVSAMNVGKDVFRLRAGADHLHFSFLGFQNIGNGAFLVTADIADLTLEDMIAKNVTRFFERGPGTICSVTGLTVRRVSVEGYSKAAFRLDQNTSQVLMEDVTGDSMRQDFANFAEGIDLSGGVHDAVFRRCTMRNSQQTRGPDDFWNGDGFTSEADTYNILFEDCVASGNTDAGFDLKSNNVTLLRCRSYDNTANFKLWGHQSVVMQECLSESPSRRGGNQGPKHVTACWGADVLVTSCRFMDDNPDAIVFHTEANDRAKPPTGSRITARDSSVISSGRLSFVDINSKVSVDGIERPFDRR